jgi:hypothetical protein
VICKRVAGVRPQLLIPVPPRTLTQAEQDRYKHYEISEDLNW